MLARQNDASDMAAKHSLPAGNGTRSAQERASDNISHGPEHNARSTYLSRQGDADLKAQKRSQKWSTLIGNIKKDSPSGTLVGRANAAEAPKAASGASQTAERPKLAPQRKNGNAVPGASSPASARTAGVSGAVQQSAKKPIAAASTATAPIKTASEPAKAPPLNQKLLAKKSGTTLNTTRQTTKQTARPTQPMRPQAKSSGWGPTMDRPGDGGNNHGGAQGSAAMKGPGPVAKAAKNRPIPVGTHPQMGVATKPPSTGGFKANFSGGQGQSAKSSLMNAFDGVFGELVNEINLAGVRPSTNVIDARGVRGGYGPQTSNRVSARSSTFHTPKIQMKGDRGGPPVRSVPMAARSDREDNITNKTMKANKGLQTVAGGREGPLKARTSVAIKEGTLKSFATRAAAVVNSASVRLGNKSLKQTQVTSIGGVRGNRPMSET
jgi:hypothetical protein